MAEDEVEADDQHGDAHADCGKHRYEETALDHPIR
jgi:hypothetical protein